MSERKEKGFLLFGLLAVVIVLVIFSPFYLTYTDIPDKSDVIVLLLGNEFNAREKVAKQLIAEGYSKYLIISYRNKVFKSSDSDGLVPIKKNILHQNRFVANKKMYENGYFESTHLEIFHAKAMMDRLGFKSAIFVSSPYHMRRVRLIADSVFEEGGWHLSFVPNRYEKTNENLWWSYKYDLKRVSSEYVKMFWFLLYSPFA